MLDSAVYEKIKLVLSEMEKNRLKREIFYEMHRLDTYFSHSLIKNLDDEYKILKEYLKYYPCNEYPILNRLIQNENISESDNILSGKYKWNGY